MGGGTRCHTRSGSRLTSATCAQLSTLPGLAAAAAAAAVGGGGLGAWEAASGCAACACTAAGGAHRSTAARAACLPGSQPAPGLGAPGRAGPHLLPLAVAAAWLLGRRRLHNIVVIIPPLVWAAPRHLHLRLRRLRLRLLGRLRRLRLFGGMALRRWRLLCPRPLALTPAPGRGAAGGTSRTPLVRSKPASPPWRGAPAAAVGGALPCTPSPAAARLPSPTAHVHLMAACVSHCTAAPTRNSALSSSLRQPAPRACVGESGGSGRGRAGCPWHARGIQCSLSFPPSMHMHAGRPRIVPPRTGATRRA